VFSVQAQPTKASQPRELFQPSQPATWVGVGAPPAKVGIAKANVGTASSAVRLGRSTAEERDEQTKVQYFGKGTAARSNCHSEAKNACFPFVVPIRTNRIEEQVRADVANFSVMFIILSQIPHSLFLTFSAISASTTARAQARQCQPPFLWHALY
jgi:hypothetical protein